MDTVMDFLECRHSFHTLLLGLCGDIAVILDRYNNGVCRLIERYYQQLLMADGRIELGGNCVLTASHPEQLPTELYTCEQLLKRLCISHHTDTPMFRNQQLGVACVSLHHTSRSDGMKIRSRHTRVPSLLLTQQLTALLWFPDGNDECQLIEAELRLYDPELCPQIGHFPLSVDVSVPLLTHFHYTRSWTMRRVQEYFSQMPVIRPLALMIPAVSGWRQVNRYRLQQKLYAIHPFQPWKRPLILVHGFLSNPLTWYPLINGLLAVDAIRHCYQIFYYQYPTGQPWMISAHLFRLAMNDLHSQYVHAKRVMRDPIIIGHSLGGLIIKAALQEPRSLIWFQLAGIDQSLSPTMGEISIQPAIQLKDLVCWHPVSFQGTARLIFIASPLKGISRSVYKQSLEPLILPQVLRYERKDRELFRKLRAALTSIRCDSPGIQLLVHSPMPGGVRWNCIAANVPFSWLTRHAGDQSDPLVTLPSALMEGSDGVLVLSGWRYWHSAIQRHPETIQWIRNIVWRTTLTI